MKKTFALTHPKLQPARLVDAIKHEIRKYLARERRKAVPAGKDYWTFDCRFGATEAEAKPMFTSEIIQYIDTAAAQQWPQFYIEILARACNHKARPDSDVE
jgi:hypothetical protein